MAAPIVTKIEVTEFSYEVQDITPHEKTQLLRSWSL